MSTRGGDTESVGTGGSLLRSSGETVSETSTGLSSSCTSASGAVGQAALAASIDRFSAAFVTYVTDLSGQMDAAGMLAQNAAADLSTAGS